MYLIDRALAYSLNVPIPGGKATYANFGEYLTDLFNFAINIAGLLALLVILFGVFKYVTSGGDSSKTKDALDWIYGAIIGFVLLLLTKLIMSIIQIN